MRVALGQIDMVWENRDASIKKAAVMIEEAAQGSCDLIVFPEMSFTGFSMNLRQIAENASESETVKKMQALAQKNKIAIGFGWAAAPEDGSDRGTNRFTLVDAAGQKIAEYSKLHPFTYGGEAEKYEKGTEIITVPFLGRTVSLFICYDLRFPEIFQIAARKADVFFVIANWPAVRSAHWETLLRARAIETQSYVVGVNCVGVRDQEEYNGGSMAVDSIGNILGKITGREGILVCDLDDRAWNLRQKFNTAADRREDFYKNYFK
ncbi:MAG: carbon-nitrogen family hydrolase [Clostridiaceae bacterium]|nr:carbon-nitrogen family hydrolase [Clostridiaceae bacterium]